MIKAEKSKTWSFILTLLVIAIYLIPNFAGAVDVSISDIEDTNKGNDISFDITIDINDPDRYVPISSTNLTIEYTGGNHIDKLECIIQPDDSYICYRTKGNHTTEFTNIDITSTKEANLGYEYGYGYGYDTGTGYGYNFGYGYGYGYPGNFGKITYHVLWHTPVNLHPKSYSARAKLIAGDKIFSSPEKQFAILTPAYPTQSHNKTVTIPANTKKLIDFKNETDTSLNIITGVEANGTIQIDAYISNPTGNASYFGVTGLDKYIAIDADSSISDALTNATIKVYYTDAEVSAAGLDENSLRLYYFNPSTNGWEKYDAPDGGVDTVNNYVWAITDHFSFWGIFGSKTPTITEFGDILDITNVKVKSVGKNKKLKPGEELTVEVDIENKGDFDIEDIELKVWFEKDGSKLKDDDGDVIEDDSEFDLDEGDDEGDLDEDDVTFEFDMPYDVEDGEEYIVHVEAEGWQSNDSSIIYADIDTSETIEFERERHELVIHKAVLNPDMIKCARNVNVELGVRDIGEKDEDGVKLTISSSELDVNIIDTFDIEEDSDDNKYKALYAFNVSDEIVEGIYPILVRLEYDDDEFVIKTINLEVQDCKKVKKVKEDFLVKKIEGMVTSPVATKPVIPPVTTISFRPTSGYLFVLLGFIILTGLVIFVFGAAIISLRKS